MWFTITPIRKIYHCSSIKPAGAQKCGIEDIRPICCRYNNDLFIGLKAIKLNKNLIERLLPFVISSANSRKP